MDLYAENILDHYRRPRCKHELTAFTVEHEEINHSCGDALKMQLRIEDGVIKEVGWTGTGCAVSQAGISMLCEDLTDMTVTDAAGLNKQDILDMLGVPVGPRRFKCALLCLHTLKNALRKHESLEMLGWIDAIGDT